MNRFLIPLLLASSFLHAQPSPPSPGSLVSWWTFDNDPEGQVLDSSSNHLHGTAENISYEATPGGRCAVFNSASDRIIIPGPGQFPPEVISSLETGTISVWFNFQNLPDGQILPILYLGEKETGTPHNSLIIEVGHGRNPANRKLYFTLVHKRFCFDSGQNLKENTWYHFVAVVDDHGNRGYLNGKLMTHRKYNLGSDSLYTDFFSAVDSSEMLSIGHGRYGQEDPFFTFKGRIDEVAIYSKALGAAAIDSLYLYGLRKVSGSLPDLENVAYGPFERNVLDLWKAPSAQPTPLVIFIHGGGFVQGSKEVIRETAGMKIISKCLQNGVSVAAINYRYATTTRLDTVLLDCARAVQYLRFRAGEWNIDKDRIAAYGSSAGGGASLWLGVHPDLADPVNEDPVLHESSRLMAVGHLNSQATYDVDQWAEIIRVPSTWANEMNFNDYKNFYKVNAWEDIYDPDIAQLRAILDMPAFIDPSDPPMYLRNMNPDTDPLNAGAVIHHPRHIYYLQEEFNKSGIESALVDALTPQNDRTDMLDFFFQYFENPTGQRARITENGLLVYPNPSQGVFRIVSRNSLGYVRIMNAMGILVLSQETLESSFSLDLQRFPAGIYFFRTGNGEVLSMLKE
jgi:hypothetical protein